MIDTTQAITYIKQVVEQLELAEDRQHREQLDIEADKRQIVQDREAVTRRESALLEKTNGYGAEVQRVEQLHVLALKMKAQVDEDRVVLAEKEAELNKREKALIDLESKQQELEQREILLASREEDVENREILVDKDKEAARSKQEDLDLREKSIRKLQEELQRKVTLMKV